MEGPGLPLEAPAFGWQIRSQEVSFNGRCSFLLFSRFTKRNSRSKGKLFGCHRKARTADGSRGVFGVTDGRQMPASWHTLGKHLVILVCVLLLVFFLVV